MIYHFHRFKFQHFIEAVAFIELGKVECELMKVINYDTFDSARTVCISDRSVIILTKTHIFHRYGLYEIVNKYE